MKTKRETPAWRHASSSSSMSFSARSSSTKALARWSPNKSSSNARRDATWSMCQPLVRALSAQAAPNLGSKCRCKALCSVAATQPSCAYIICTSRPSTSTSVCLEDLDSCPVMLSASASPRRLLSPSRVKTAMQRDVRRTLRDVIKAATIERQSVSNLCQFPKFVRSKSSRGRTEIRGNGMTNTRSGSPSRLLLNAVRKSRRRFV
mmetsp:Transcript_52006/g.117566  ORF Transcript_52006/g.117566 Transcript_52006/m.117566 type:complete len:205 (+) Transcript_52006:100-714(+)